MSTVTGHPVNNYNYKSYKRVYKATVKKVGAQFDNQPFDAEVNNVKQLWANLNDVISTKITLKIKTLLIRYSFQINW